MHWIICDNTFVFCNNKGEVTLWGSQKAKGRVMINDIKQ